MIYDSSLKPFLLTGYDNPIKSAKVINDGHTGNLCSLAATESCPKFCRFFLATVDIPDDFEANMIVPYLNATYKLVQFHFHWGHDDLHGSEHVVFKEHFPLEVKVYLWIEAVSYCHNSYLIKDAHGTFETKYYA